MASTHLESTLHDIANVACDKAAEKAGDIFRSLRGGRNSFYPVVNMETNNVGVGVNHDYHYLVYLNRGFASFPMRAIYGKIIPMLINGKLVFRKVTGINQFRPGHRNYWQRDINGELVEEYKQRRAWVHPGYGPTNFIQSAVREAIDENQKDIDLAIIYDKYEELEQEIDRWR